MTKYITVPSSVEDGGAGGAVDSVNGQTGTVTLDADDISDASTTNKYATLANIGTIATGATAKTTPVDADTIPITDSAASNVLKKVTWANIKATLKSYFDTLYQPLASVLTNTTASFTTALETKLNGIATGATANDTDANLKARANHTGTQTLATISDVTSSASELNILDGVTADTGEINKLDGLLPTTTELNYVDGVTSAIQTQIDSKTNDADVVHDTGNENVAGIKTFSSFPVTPSSAPSTDYQTANKKYVDDSVTAGGGYTDEQAQDAVGGMVADTATIDLTYTDGTPELKADVKTASITEDMQVLADNTTNNFSTTKHGYVPKGTNVGSFLKDDGTWAAPTGGGDALTSSSLAQFAPTTSAQLAGVMSNETGSGLLVFNDSPILITPALGTPSALVGTNITGTASGFTAGNVTTNANLTGDVTSSGNATTIAWTRNPYCFSAWDSGGTTLTDNTAIQINFATELYDYNNNFASSAYTAPYAGVYHFNATVEVSTLATGVTLILWLYVGGAAAKILQRWAPGANNSIGGATDILLTASQVVTLRVTQDSAGNETTGAAADRTYFSGHLVHRTA